MKMKLPIISYYYRRLFLHVLFVSLSAVLVLSILFYGRVHQDLKDQFLKDNLSILQKSAYSIESIHYTVSTLMATLYKDTDIQQAMYGYDPEDELVSRTIINLKNNVMSHYTFIRHLYIYNARNGRVYSTRGSFDGIPDDLTQLLTGENPVQYLRPYYHVIPGGSESVEPLTVVTYCIYEYTDGKGAPQGALLVDVSLDWLSSMLATDRPVPASSQYFEGIIALDSNDHILNESPAARKAFNDLKGLDVDPVAWQGSMNMTPVTINEQEYMVTSLPVHSANWNLVRFQLASNTYRALLDWQQRMIIIILICISITLLIALFVAVRIYKPVRQLVQKAGLTGSVKDEFKYLETVFADTRQELFALRKNSELSQRRKKEQECWSRILEDNDDLESCLLPEWGDGSHFVCLAAISQYSQIKKNLNPEGEFLYRFSLIEMLRDGLAPHNLCVDIKEDLIALICPADQYDALKTQAQSLAELVDRQLKSRIVFAYSNPVASLDDISVAYHQAAKILKYRYLFDHKQLLSPEDVQFNEQNVQHAVDPRIFTACKEAMYCGKTDDIRKCMTDLHQQLLELAYTDVAVELIRFIASIRNAVEEWNAVRLEPILFDASKLISDVYESERLSQTIEQIGQQVMNLAENSEEGQDHLVDARIDIYREYIQSNFSQSDLTVSFIAEKFHVSAKQMNRLFKRSVGSTVSDFLTETRMQHAAKLLVETDHKAQDIALNVGFENTNYFYTLFKKRFGVTPKKYQFINRIRPDQSKK